MQGKKAKVTVCGCCGFPLKGSLNRITEHCKRGRCGDNCKDQQSFELKANGDPTQASSYETPLHPWCTDWRNQLQEKLDNPDAQVKSRFGVKQRYTSRFQIGNHAKAKSELGIPKGRDLNKVYDSQSDYESDFERFENSKRKKQENKTHKIQKKSEESSSDSRFQIYQVQPNDRYQNQQTRHPVFRNIQKHLEIKQIPGFKNQNEYQAGINLTNYLASGNNNFWQFLNEDFQSIEELYKNQAEATRIVDFLAVFDPSVGNVTAAARAQPILFYLWFHLQKHSNIEVLKQIPNILDTKSDTNDFYRVFKSQLQCLVKVIYGSSKQVSEWVIENQSKIVPAHRYALQYFKEQNDQGNLQIDFLKLLTHLKREDSNEEIQVLFDYWNLLDAEGFKWSVSMKYFSRVIELMLNLDTIQNLRNNETILAEEQDPEQWYTILEQLQKQRPPTSTKESSDPFIEMNRLNQKHRQLPIAHEAFKATKLCAVTGNTLKILRQSFQNCQPSLTQQAVAQFAVHAALNNNKYVRPQKVPVFIPPSGGKSRVAATIAWMALSKGFAEKITFVYPNNYLKLRETDQFVPFFKAAGYGKKVEWVSQRRWPKEEIQTTSNKTLIIIDESDEYVVETPLSFYDRCKDFAVVALSATPSSNGFEENAYRRLGFLPAITPPEDLQQEYLAVDQELNKQQIKSLIKNATYPILIYCTHEQYEEYMIEDQDNYLDQTITGINLITDEVVDCETKPDLQKLEGPQRLYCTKENYLRALDYRSTQRIDLIILTKFSSKRACQQGMGRVGRQGDPCARYCLSGLGRQSYAEDHQMWTRMNEQLADVEAKIREEQQKKQEKQKRSQGPKKNQAKKYEENQQGNTFVKRRYEKFLGKPQGSIIGYLTSQQDNMQQ